MRPISDAAPSAGSVNGSPTGNPQAGRPNQAKPASPIAGNNTAPAGNHPAVLTDHAATGSGTQVKSSPNDSENSWVVTGSDSDTGKKLTPPKMEVEHEVEDQADEVDRQQRLALAQAAAHDHQSSSSTRTLDRTECLGVIGSTVNGTPYQDVFMKMVDDEQTIPYIAGELNRISLMDTGKSLFKESDFAAGDQRDEMKSALSEET